MKQFIKYITVAATLLTFSHASAATWQIDQDHAEIRFEIDHILTTVSGRFNDFKGDIRFDPQDPSGSRFDFTVKVESVDTNNGKRDNHLRSKDFFDVGKYPDMKFKTSDVTRIDGNRFRIKGDMTIKDVTKALEFDFQFIPPKPHPFAKGKKVGGFVGRFSIPRLDYHVGNGKFLKMGVVGSNVDVEISMEALTDQ